MSSYLGGLFRAATTASLSPVTYASIYIYIHSFLHTHTLFGAATTPSLSHVILSNIIYVYMYLHVYTLIFIYLCAHTIYRSSDDGIAEPCHIYKWVLSHMKEWRRLYEWAAIWVDLAEQWRWQRWVVTVSHHICEWVMSHIWMNESRRIHEWAAIWVDFAEQRRRQRWVIGVSCCGFDWYRNGSQQWNWYGRAPPARRSLMHLNKSISFRHIKKYTS